MAEDAAGAVRRTPRPDGAVPELWWSPSEQALWEKDDDGYFCPDYYPVRGSAELPADAVQLVGPDQRRPVVLLRAEDCACPTGGDCPHGPEPVDALDLAVWLHAEQTWRVQSLVEQVNTLGDAADERQARIDAALALTEPHPLRHWDTQWPIRAALEGMTAAEYEGKDGTDFVAPAEPAGEADRG